MRAKSPKPIKKIYYSIGEVSNLTGLKQCVLRYWETEFPMLSPAKNRAGNRVYKEKDIKLIKYIKHLLYERRYTIEGARRQLENLRAADLLPSGDIKDLNDKQYDAEYLLKIIGKIKAELKEILDILDGRD